MRDDGRALTGLALVALALGTAVRGSRGVARRGKPRPLPAKGQPMTSYEYEQSYPSVPAHMISHPGEKAVIDSGFVRASVGWPTYEGGYLHWQLMDVRKYVEMGLAGWAEHADEPYRLYVTDYDDWSVERQFVTEAGARSAIASMVKARSITTGFLHELGLRTA